MPLAAERPEQELRDRLLAVMPRVSRSLKAHRYEDCRHVLSRILGPDDAKRAVECLKHKSRAAGYARDDTMLTPAEWASIWNTACGLTAGEIGQRYNRTTYTVLSHRKSALRKLGVHTAAGAVAECYRRDIFDRDDLLEPVDW